MISRHEYTDLPSWYKNVRTDVVMFSYAFSVLIIIINIRKENLTVKYTMLASLLAFITLRISILFLRKEGKVYRGCTWMSILIQFGIVTTLYRLEDYRETFHQLIFVMPLLSSSHDRIFTCSLRLLMAAVCISRVFDNATTYAAVLLACIPFIIDIKVYLLVIFCPRPIPKEKITKPQDFGKSIEKKRGPLRLDSRCQVSSSEPLRNTM